MAVHIVTDSCADIPTKLVADLDISVVPLNVHINDKVYKDGLDIVPNELYNQIRNSKIVAKTSQPSPGEFVSVYEELLALDDQPILSLHLSNGLSGTYQSAVMAKKIIGTDRITVVDSLSASIALGSLVVETAKMSGSGAKVKALIEFVNQTKDTARILLLVDSLEYLHRNGRIGKAASLVGSMLKIKPVLTIEEGIIAPLDKVRGVKKARKRIIQQMVTDCDGHNGSIHGMIAHSDAYLEAEILHNQIQEQIPSAKLTITDVGCVIGANIGPGAIGVGYCIFQKD